MEEKAPDQRGRGFWRSALSYTTVFALSYAAGFGSSAAVDAELHAREAHIAMGTVRCVGGGAVLGVWVGTRGSEDSGWSGLQQTGNNSIVGFTHQIRAAWYEPFVVCAIPGGGQLQAHVEAPVPADVTVAVSCGTSDQILGSALAKPDSAVCITTG